ncbi:hypothetical protein [Geoglobus acetivorans]|uniref:Uncharacterized protein n=1 Tax=Geoglobus acetivorans TaxID=565033 RepID=A0ABZ3H3G9_GEOAI|nr:hypothetical protein [Geoglobus acetivorans]
MTLKCPDCGADLPAWAKIVPLFGRARFIECPNCGVLIGVKIRHEGLHRYVVAVLLLILTGWVFLLEISRNPVLLADRVQIQNYVEQLSNPEKYTLPFILAILILWYSARFGSYTLEITNSSAEKRRISFILLLLLFVPAAVFVTAVGLYIYLAEGENWFTGLVVLLDAVIIIGLKREREKMKKLKQNHS